MLVHQNDCQKQEKAIEPVQKKRKIGIARPPSVQMADWLRLECGGPVGGGLNK